MATYGINLPRLLSNRNSKEMNACEGQLLPMSPLAGLLSEFKHVSANLERWRRSLSRRQLLLLVLDLHPEHKRTGEIAEDEGNAGEVKAK